MKAIIIEDEVLSATHLKRLLQRIDPGIEILGVFDSVKTSVDYLKQGVSADLIFLDIHLSDGLSFEIFQDFQSDTPIIFTTAYDEYALKAFDLNSIDYLLKPIGMDDLQKSLDKFARINQQQHLFNFNQLLPLLHQNQQVNSYKSRFLVKLGEQISSLKTNEISHFIAEDGIVLLVSSSGKKFPVDYTLDQLEQLLDPSDFFRINRKVCIHQQQIGKIQTFFNSRLKVHHSLLDEEASIVSRDRVANFKAWLDR